MQPRTCKQNTTALRTNGEKRWRAQHLVISMLRCQESLPRTLPPELLLVQGSKGLAQEIQLRPRQGVQVRNAKGLQGMPGISRVVSRAF